MAFPVVMDNVKVGPQRRLSAENLCFQNVVLEKILESPLNIKEIKPVNPKRNHPYIFIGSTDSFSVSPLATCCIQLTLWKRPICWETLRAGGEGGDRG